MGLFGLFDRRVKLKETYDEQVVLTEQDKEAFLRFREKAEEITARLEERKKQWTWEYRLFSTYDSTRLTVSFDEKQQSLAAWDEKGWELVSETYVPDLEWARDISFSDSRGRSHWAYIFRRKVVHERVTLP